MADITKIQIQGTNGQTNTYDIKDLIARNVTENIIYVKNFGAKGDGTTDDTDAIQECIDNNPHKTIIFSEGNYRISAPLQIYEDNESQVDLFFESGSRLFTTTAINALIEIGKVKTGATSHWTRYVLGDIVTISGTGILDATNCDKAIYVCANRKFNRLIGLNIVNCNSYGIYLDSATLSGVNNVSDSQILNVNITGTGNANANTIGFAIISTDNEFNEIRIQRFLIGFQLTGGGNIFDNIHITQGFINNGNIASNFNKSIAFEFNGTGFDMLNNIYIDTYGKPFVFNGANKYTIFNNIFTYYYFNETTSVTSIFTFNVACRINVTNSRFSLTNSGTNKIVDLSNITDNNFRRNFPAFNYINFYNCTTYHSVLDRTDPYNSMQIRNIDSNILETVPYTTRMTQNSWYPVALIRQGAYNFKFSMENSEISEVTLSIPSTGTPTITTKNIYSQGSHNDDWNLGIAEGFTEDNQRYCYLCVQSIVTNLHYNPTIFDVSKNFLNLIYSYPEYNGNEPLSNPSILAQTPLNQ